MNIRCATIEDLDRVTEVEALCFPPAEAASRESFEGRLTVFPNHFWVSEVDGQIVGFVNGFVTDEENLTDEMFADANMHNEKGAWQMIFGVDTIPEYQRRGIAEQVLNKVIEVAKVEGRKGLVLTCKEHMLHYYAKFGFINEGVSGSEHGGALWYQMRITF
jgi:ribosomal protein S18 acetylase RimI-like enzyme